MTQTPQDNTQTQEAQQESIQKSRINQMAALRLTQKVGPHVLRLFLEYEKVMNASGGSSFFGNVGFIEPTDEVKEGELIPSIHFSLQPHQPTLSIPIELEPTDEE